MLGSRVPGPPLVWNCHRRQILDRKIMHLRNRNFRIWWPHCVNGLFLTPPTTSPGPIWVNHPGPGHRPTHWFQKGAKQKCMGPCAGFSLPPKGWQTNEPWARPAWDMALGPGASSRGGRGQGSGASDQKNNPHKSCIISKSLANLPNVWRCF